MTMNGHSMAAGAGTQMPQMPGPVAEPAWLPPVTGAAPMQTMTPCLWFDGQAEEAARFYVSIFKNSKLGAIVRYGAAAAAVSGQPPGSVMTVSFELEGREFLALNGGPTYRFTPAISFMVGCETQPELDALWDRLSRGGELMDCGWLTDQFGVAWQIIPRSLDRMMQDPDSQKVDRVMDALLRMKKLDIATLEAAYAHP
jgi:predicted 3-demethylubiquinone-9 3-methyltransferase (glyoxalase superfamily)